MALIDRLQELKNDHKTSYLAESYEKLCREEAEVNEMLAADPSLSEIAAGELEMIQTQKTTLEGQIEAIEKADKEIEQFPNEVVLEIRAGAGGDEASLFAAELAGAYQAYAERFGFGRGWIQRCIIRGPWKGSIQISPL
jgi:peptide chain release factor 1